MADRSPAPPPPGASGPPPPPGSSDQAARAVRVVVRGQVQGVGFRASCAMRAEALGVAGWVRNQPDGSVELVASGAPAAVTALLEWCRQGPPMARVSGVTLVDTSTADAAGAGPGGAATGRARGGFVVR